MNKTFIISILVLSIFTYQAFAQKKAVVTVTGGNANDITTANNILGDALGTGANSCSKSGNTAACTVVLTPAAVDTPDTFKVDTSAAALALITDVTVTGAAAFQAAVSDKAKKYQKIEYIGANSVTLAAGKTLTFKWILDVTLSGTTESATGKAFITSATETGLLTLTDVHIQKAASGATLTGLTFFNGKGTVTIEGGNYAAKPGTDGLFVIDGANANADATKLVIKKLTENSVDYKPTFEDCTSGTTAPATARYLFNLHQTVVTDAKKSTVSDAIFKSNTFTPAFMIQSSAVLFTTVTFESNKSKKPLVCIEKKSGGTESNVGFDTVTFKSNENTAAGTTAAERLMDTNIYVKDSFLFIKKGTYESNKAAFGGVFSVDMVTTAANTPATPTTLITSQTTFLSTSDKPTFQTNELVGNNGVSKVGAVKSLHQFDFYNTVDDSDGLKGTYKVLNAVSSDFTFQNDNTHVLATLTATTAGELTVATSENTGKTATWKKWKDVKNSVAIPSFTFTYSDAFGNALGDQVTFTSVADPRVWLYNQNLGTSGNSYLFGKNMASTPATTGNTAARRRRILAAATQVGSPGDAANNDVLPTDVVSHMKEADNMALDYNGDSASTNTCWSGKKWYLTAKGKLTVASTKTSFTLAQVAIDTTVTAWYWAIQAPGMKWPSAFKFSKNFFASADSAAAITAAKYFYVMPMNTIDTGCPLPAANIVCTKKNEYVGITACKTCDAVCGTCSGAKVGANPNCVTCSNGLAAQNGMCCTSGQIYVSTTAGVAATCQDPTAVKTAAETVIAKTTTLTADELALATNYMAATVPAVVIDVTNTCRAVGDSADCNGKGTCTTGACKCDTGFSGRICKTAKADFDNYKLVVNAGVKLAETTITAALVTTPAKSDKAAADILNLLSNTDAVDCAALAKIATFTEVVNKYNQFTNNAARGNLIAACAQELTASANSAACNGAATPPSATEKATKMTAAQTKLNNQIASLISSQITKLRGSYGTPVVINGADNFQVAVQAIDPTKAPKMQSNNAVVTFSATLSTQSSLKDPTTTCQSSSQNPQQFSQTGTEVPISQVFSFRVDQQSSGKTTEVTVDTTAIGTGNKITAVLSRVGTTDANCARYDTTSKKWDVAGITQPTAGNTADLSCELPTFSDFTIIPKPTVQPGTGGTNALKIVMNMTIAALIAFFAMMN